MHLWAAAGNPVAAPNPTSKVRPCYLHGERQSGCGEGLWLEVNTETNLVLQLVGNSQPVWAFL